eukprot:gene31195-6342_t
MAEVDAAEINFLIVHYLKNGPFAEAAELIERQARSIGAFPTRTDFQGGVHASSHDAIAAQHPHLPHNTLALLLNQLLVSKRESGLPHAKNVSSLLAAGPYGLLSSAPGPSTCSAPTAWLPSAPHPTRHANYAHMMLKRELGGRPMARPAAAEMYGSHVNHQASFRGHKLAVYCLAYDCTGQKLITGSDDWLVKASFRGYKLAVYCLAYDCTGQKLITGSDDWLVQKKAGWEAHVIEHPADYDRTGQKLKTGSDDWLVKIWSAGTGTLLKTCRGHSQEINDFAVAVDNTAIASASNDSSIRVWSLQDVTLGHPVSVLLGHDAGVTFIDFSSASSVILLSSSFDGTCRIWNAREGGAALHVLTPSPAFGVTNLLDADIMAVTENEPQNTRKASLLCCAFSPDSSYIVAGCSNFSAYLWRWEHHDAIASDAGAGTSGLRELVSLPPEPVLELKGHASDLIFVVFNSGGGAFVTGAKDGIVRLEGHASDVIFVVFNSGGGAFVTRANDGTVRVWRQKQFNLGHLPGSKPSTWVEALILCCPIEEAATLQAQGGARQRRRAPEQPSISQVVWTKDDLKIIAGATDNRIRVWDSHSGVLLRVLEGHQQPVHVLENHPTDQRLLLSAGYDGHAVVWDVDAGVQVYRYATADTMPVPGMSWSDPLQVVDGHFSPDGSTFAISDVAGQFHIFSSGPRDFLAPTPYDQFLKLDYSPLTRDQAQNVVDQESRMPPHLITKQYLCDFLMEPYMEPEQQAVKEAEHEMGGHKHRPKLPLALSIHPPTVAAAVWEAIERGWGESSIRMASERSAERHRELVLDVLAVQEADAMASMFPPRPAAAPARAGGEGGGRGGRSRAQSPRGGREQGQYVESRGGGLRRRGRVAGQGPKAPRVDMGKVSISCPGGLGRGLKAGGQIWGPKPPGWTRASDSEIVAESESEASLGVDVNSSSSSSSLYALSSDSEVVAESESEASLGVDVNSSSSSSGPDGSDRERGGEERERAEVQARYNLRGEDRSEPVLDEGANGMRLRSQRGRHDPDHEEEPAFRVQGGEDVSDAMDDDQAGTAAAAKPRNHKRQRRRDSDASEQAAREDLDERSSTRLRGAPAPDFDDELPSSKSTTPATSDLSGLSEDSEEDENDRRRSKRREADKRRQKNANRRRNRSQANATVVQEEEPGWGSLARQPVSNKARPAHCHEWLQASASGVSPYTPQCGDAVVYIEEGHAQFLQLFQDPSMKTPRDKLYRSKRVRMRPAEPCRVVDVQYFIGFDGLTYASLHMELSDPLSGLCGQRIDVELPHPIYGHAEFVVLAISFYSALTHCWEIGDTFKSFQPSGNKEKTLGKWLPGPSGNKEKTVGKWLPGVIVKVPSGNKEKTLGKWLPGPSGNEEKTVGKWLPGVIVKVVEKLAAQAPAKSGRQQRSSAPRTNPRGGSNMDVASSSSAPDSSQLDSHSQIQWGKYGVQWYGQKPFGYRFYDLGPDSQSDAYLSPWELFEATKTIEDVTRSYPLLDAGKVLAVEAALNLAEDSGRFSELRTTPAANATFPRSDGKSGKVAYNARCPLPLSVATLRARVGSGYYRTGEAIKHDAGTIAANAIAFNGPDADVSQDAELLVALVSAAIDGTLPPLITPATGSRPQLAYFPSEGSTRPQGTPSPRQSKSRGAPKRARGHSSLNTLSKLSNPDAASGSGAGQELSQLATGGNLSLAGNANVGASRQVANGESNMALAKQPAGPSNQAVNMDLLKQLAAVFNQQHQARLQQQGQPGPSAQPGLSAGFNLQQQANRLAPPPVQPQALSRGLQELSAQAGPSAHQGLPAPPRLSAQLGPSAQPGLPAPPRLSAQLGLPAPPRLSAQLGPSAQLGLPAPPRLSAQPGLPAPPRLSAQPGLPAPPRLSAQPGLPAPARLSAQLGTLAQPGPPAPPRLSVQPGPSSSQPQGFLQLASPSNSLLPHQAQFHPPGGGQGPPSSPQLSHLVALQPGGGIKPDPAPTSLPPATSSLPTPSPRHLHQPSIIPVKASRGPSPPPSASASQKPPSPRLPHLSHNLPTSSARSPAHSSPGLVSGNRSTVTTEVGGVAGHRRKGTLDGRWPKDNTAQPYPHQLRPPLQSPGQRLNAELRQQPQSPLELSYQQASQPPQMSVEQSYGLASEPPQSYQQASQRPWASAEHSYGQPPHSSLEQSYQQASQSPLTSVERSYGQASQPPQTSIEQNYGLASPPPQSSLEQSYQQASQPPRTSAEQSYAQALQPPLGSSEQSPWKASVQPWTSVEHGYQQAPSPPPGSLEPSHPSSSQQPVGSERQGIRPLEHLRKLLHTAADPHAVHKGANGVSSGQAEGLLHPAAVPHAVHNRVHGVGSSQAEGPPHSTATPQLHGSTGETSPLDSSWNSNGSRPPLTSAACSNGARWLPQDALPHQNPPSAQDLGPPSLADRIGEALRLQALSGAQGRQQQQPPVSGAVSDADCNPALRLEAGPGACGLQQQPPVSAAVSHADYSEALRLQAGSGVSGLQQQQQQQSSQPNGPGSLLMSILAQRRGEPQAAQMAYLAPSQSPQLLGRYQNAPSQSPQLLGSYQTAPSQSPQLLGSYQTAPSQSPQLLSSYQTAPSQSPQLLGSYQTAPSQSPQLQRTLQGYPGLYHTTMAGHPQASYMMHSGSPPVYALQQVGQPGSYATLDQLDQLHSNSILNRFPPSQPGAASSPAAHTDLHLNSNLNRFHPTQAGAASSPAPHDQHQGTT